MSTKKVMILGAAEGQLPFLNICKKRGYEVIVVSVKGNYPCFEYADKCYYYDTRDKENILKAAIAENIDAITTDQTDVSVPTVAYVAEKMGLRGIGYETSLKFTNKYLMRKAAFEAGVDVPKFDKAESLEQAVSVAEKIGYPLMIKPADSSGSRGVLKVNSEKELRDNYEETAKYSKAPYILLEQFIVGKEYLVDGFAMEGKYTNLDLGEKEYFDVPNIFVSKMCMFSSAKMIEDRVGLKVLEANKKLVEGIGLKFGITHAEYLYSPSDDKVYLVEVAARGGGVYLSSDITPRASGFNTNEALIDYLVEGKATAPQWDKLLKRVSAWVCFSFPEGEVASISGVEDVKAIDGVYMLSMHDVYVGKKTIKLENDSEKYGPALIVADTPEECYKIIEKIRNTLKIEVKTTDGIKGLIW